ncbi:nuclease A inhibitor-like protein [Pontibacter ummariensis]|uniref:Nuclease A inhibitor-like protein n=1 Tax=Pontibacter ummariensis TaxID=1610492 RepID=A0A239FN33_9BACT|nr:nuclease A inhibitor family protein [Pontibacter ummariensis]PRY11999.1 nuclease A inhibitor-like protein [Pontibacter ummariensis]SNS58231.1 Nuclease A inhibitor-like protein [Pontibacter ummariensis]
MDKTQLQKELMPVVDGLLMQSEIDAPFEFVYLEDTRGKQLNPGDVAVWAGKPAGMGVETKDLDAFMQEMQSVDSDARDKTKGKAEAYQQLTTTLRRLLQDIKVYCLTEIGTEAYILGKAETGDYAGLRTMVMHDQATVAKKNDRTERD